MCVFLKGPWAYIGIHMTCIRELWGGESSWEEGVDVKRNVEREDNGGI